MTLHAIAREAAMKTVGRRRIERSIVEGNHECDRARARGACGAYDELNGVGAALVGHERWFGGVGAHQLCSASVGFRVKRPGVTQGCAIGGRRLTPVEISRIRIGTAVTGQCGRRSAIGLAVDERFADGSRIGSKD